MSLSVLAHAVTGRPVVLERAPAGAAASTDGTTIGLPADLDFGSATARRTVLVLSALMSTDALRSTAMRRLGRSTAAAADRYLLLEVDRACTLLQGRLPRRLVDDVRAALGGHPPSASSEESLRRALDAEALPDAPAWFGELRPRHVRGDAGQGMGDGGESVPADLVPADPDEDDADEDDSAAEKDRSLILEMLASPVRSAVRKLTGTRRSGSADASGGAEMPIAGGRWTTRSSAKGRLVPGGGSPRVEMSGHLVVGAHYPEWDTRVGHYRDDWTTVGEFDPPVPVDGDVEVEATAGNRLLMRKLAQLGLSWRTHRGEPTGDSLDLSALVELRTRIAAGEGGEADVYTAHRRTSQRLGVLILLDATGSTAESSEGAEVFARQRNLALGLTSALDELGVRVGTYAFYSRGRGNVRFLHAKSFDEPWSAAARRRLLSVGPSGFTRLGAAIRHATHVIATRVGTDHQLVVVIGDGVVYDDGYEGTYATEDSRFAIEEAAAQGVGLVGLSVAPLPDESIWPPEQHRVARDVTELAPQVAELFGGALKRSRGARRPTSRKDTHVGAGV